MIIIGEGLSWHCLGLVSWDRCFGGGSGKMCDWSCLGEELSWELLGDKVEIVSDD